MVNTIRKCPNCKHDMIEEQRHDMDIYDCTHCTYGFVKRKPSAVSVGEGVPVAEVVSMYGHPESWGRREIKELTDIQALPYGTKLYTAPPAGAVGAENEELLNQLHEVTHEAIALGIEKEKMRTSVDEFKARLLAALEQDRNRYYSITTSSTASDSMVSDAAVSCAAIEGVIKRIERGEFDAEGKGND